LCFDFGKHEEALAMYNEAVDNQLSAYQMVPTELTFRMFLRNHLTGMAREYRDLGRLTDAVATSRRTQELWPDDPDMILKVAAEIAACVPIAARNQDKPAALSRTEANRYADMAVETLKTAVAKGFNDVEKMQFHYLLDPIRDREDYQAIERKMSMTAPVVPVLPRTPPSPDPVDVKAYEVLTKRFHGLAEIDRAIAEQDRVLAQAPADKRALNIRGALYRLRGDNDRAIAEHTKALEFDFGHGWSYHFRGLALSEKGDHKSAIDDFSAAILKEPGLAEAFIYRADCRYRIGNHDQAMEDFENAAKLTPNDARIYGLRAIALANKNKLDDALADESKAIELAPDHVAYYLLRGEIYRLRNAFDQALADQSRAIALEPENPAPYRFRALTYAAKGDLEKAIADDGAGLKLASGALALKILRERAFLYRRTRKSELAIADFDAIIERNPRDAPAYCERGRTWAANGDRKRALADFDEAIRIDSKDSWTYMSRAEVRYSQADYRGALADYDAAIRTTPDESRPHNERAWFLATCPEAAHRDGKQAVVSATQACELTQWKNAPYVDTLAASYAEAGDFEKAVHWQQKAAELLPKDSDERAGMADRLKRYQNRTPYHEKPPSDAHGP
jgi:tetratricopeptide (TPR) repeat protein